MAARARLADLPLQELAACLNPLSAAHSPPPTSARTLSTATLVSHDVADAVGMHVVQEEGEEGEEDALSASPFLDDDDDATAAAAAAAPAALFTPAEQRGVPSLRPRAASDTASVDDAAMLNDTDTALRRTVLEAAAGGMNAAQAQLPMRTALCAVAALAAFTVHSKAARQALCSSVEVLADIVHAAEHVVAALAVLPLPATRMTGTSSPREEAGAIHGSGGGAYGATTHGVGGSDIAASVFAVRKSQLAPLTYPYGRVNAPRRGRPELATRGGGALRRSASATPGSWWQSGGGGSFGGSAGVRDADRNGPARRVPTLLDACIAFVDYVITILLELASHKSYHHELLAAGVLRFVGSALVCGTTAAGGARASAPTASGLALPALVRLRAIILCRNLSTTAEGRAALVMPAYKPVLRHLVHVMSTAGRAAGKPVLIAHA
ncbi:hypothetical protein EON68_03005, partial [archaeon]